MRWPRWPFLSGFQVLLRFYQVSSAGAFGLTRYREGTCLVLTCTSKGTPPNAEAQTPFPSALGEGHSPQVFIVLPFVFFRFTFLIRFHADKHIRISL